MCRSIKPLFNFEPVATDAEIHEAALQYVRKISGFTRPARGNEVAFAAAVDAITAISRDLLRALETSAPPKDRAIEAAKARARVARRGAR